jgi:Tol biopolymer transport system component
LSPNDDQIAFVRSLNADQCGLFIANSDGTEEKMVANRKKPYCHSRLAWSRDGRRIAFFVGQGDTGGANTQLYTHEITSGAEAPVSDEKWYHTYMPAWLPNDRGIIFSGRNPREVTNSLWQVNFPGGETRRITDGLERLTDLSITADGSTLLAVKSQLDSSLAVSPINDPSNFTKIGSAFYGLTWLLEGKIVYANSTDNSLWKIDPDGAGQKQLTFDESGYLNPTASADGGYIYYTRDSGEVRHIWRMNPDGSGNVQMTTGSGEQKPNVSKDGQWLYYQSTGKSSATIWRMSAHGGEPVQITTEASSNPSVSPDGRLLAYSYRSELGGDIAIGVLDLESSRIVRRFEMPKGEFVSARRIMWTNDSRSVIFIKQDFDRVANLWQYPVDGSAPLLLTYYKDDEIFDFGFSPNNQLLAVIRGDYRNEAVLITDFR